MTLIPTTSPIRPLLALALLAANATACALEKDLASSTDAETDAATTAASTDPTDAGTTGPGGDSSTSGSSTSGDSTSDGSSGDSTTGDPALGCPDHPAVDDCCCFLKSNNLFVENVCTAEREVLCADAVLNCPDMFEGGGSCQGGAADDEAAVDCVLAALADTKPGTLRVRFGSSENPGYWAGAIDLHLLGDGTAYRVEDWYLDLGGEYEDVGRYALRPPAFFTDCIAAAIDDKAACLRNAVTGPAEELCIPGFEYDNF